MSNRIISPSLLAANFINLFEDIKKVEDLGINRFHLDVMDGHFVPNISFGPFIIEQIRKVTKSHLETHLMISRPNNYYADFVNAGSDTIIIHSESVDNIEKEIKIIKSLNVKAGIAINPDTKIEQISNFLDLVDYILIMTVHPGFGGQKFIDKCIDKINYCKTYKLEHKKDFVIGVDGGIKANNAYKVFDAGADIAIVGSGLYQAENISKTYNELIDAR
jgi:ribulose-phosphate 3-epimerase